jgi:hypothetical protein
MKTLQLIKPWRLEPVRQRLSGSRIESVAIEMLTPCQGPAGEPGSGGGRVAPDCAMDGVAPYFLGVISRYDVSGPRA